VDPGQKVRYGRESYTVIEVYKEEVSLRNVKHRYSGWKILAWRPGKTVRSFVEDFRW